MNLKSVFLAISNILLSSCNHVFYQPNNYFYSDPEKLHVEYENLEWKNSEGLNLQVLLMLSKNKPKGSILHLHGNAQNRSSHYYYSYWLTEYGYQVYVPDYRGYGSSEGKPTRKGLLDDVKFFIDEVCKQAHKPVFLFAQSLGGSVAIPALVAKTPNCIQGVIIESPFASYRRIAREKLSEHWISWLFQYPFSYLVSDEESPIDYIGELKIPTLFIHGTADSIVPYQHSVDLYQHSGAKEKELWTIQDGRHIAVFALKDSPYKTKLVDWISKR